MLVIAKAAKGAEFFYSSGSAHKASARSADYIVAVLNKEGYKLRDGEVWHKFCVGPYDDAWAFAEDQSFTVRKGIVSERFR